MQVKNCVVTTSNITFTDDAANFIGNENYAGFQYSLRIYFQAYYFEYVETYGENFSQWPDFTFTLTKQ